jgi:hypothetical protein
VGRVIPAESKAEDGDFLQAEWLEPYLNPPARENMRIYGAPTLLSPTARTAAPFTSWSASITPAGCTCLTCGASRLRPTSGLNPSATCPIEVRKATLASILRKSRHGGRLNEDLEHNDGEAVFPPRLQDGAGGDCLEAAGIALPIRTLRIG